MTSKPLRIARKVSGAWDGLLCQRPDSIATADGKCLLDQKVRNSFSTRILASRGHRKVHACDFDFRAAQSATPRASACHASNFDSIPSKRTIRVVHECRSRFQTIDCLPEAWLEAWLCKERGESVTRDRLVCQEPSNIFTAVFCQWIPCRSTSKRKLVSTGTKLSRFEAEVGGRG